MACSTELRIPKPWLKYHDDIKNEPIDSELLSQDELFAWLKDLELSREKSSVENLIFSLRPYHAMRHQFVRFSGNNALNKELFKLWANVFVAVFASDDVLERAGEDEIRPICEAYQSLDKHICDQFPQFPTIIEMKAFLLQQNVQEKLIPHIIYLQDFSNKIAKSLIEHKNFPNKEVRDFWRRLVVIIALYFEGVWNDTKITAGLYSEDVWTRVLASGVMPWLIPQDVISGDLVNTSKHLSLLTELYFLETFFCMVVNDMYSYRREMKSNLTISNMVETIIVEQDCEESEAVQKCIELVNAVVKIMYQKIEHAKQENPEDQHLWRMLDNIGLSTTGWYYFHEYSPQYDVDAFWRLSAVGVEDGELEEWRQAIDEEPPNKVMPLLLNSSPQARKVSEAILSGDLNMGAIFKLSG